MGKKTFRIIIPILILIAFICIGVIAWQESTKTVVTPTPEPTPPIVQIKMTIGDPYVYLDGKRALIDPENIKVVPVIHNERTLLPLRLIAEGLGMGVNWDDVSHSIVLTAENNATIEFVIGQRTAVSKGVQVDLDTPVTIIEERAFLPLRFIADEMDFEVEWDDITKGIIVTRKNSPFTTEELAEKRILAEDLLDAATLAKAAAELCTKDSAYYDLQDFSIEVVINLDLVRPYLPNSTAGFSEVRTGVSPWIISVQKGVFRVKDSSPEGRLYFEGDWINVTPLPKPPTPIPSPTDAF
ncbi:MAG: copper amine oxidase N-terminal domain-containing protein, partial [Clostridiales bacterium]|nr:copper amine oxidase N-terminal domain-containing protein [Clostridiales bacterium]